MKKSDTLYDMEVDNNLLLFEELKESIPLYEEIQSYSDLSESGRFWDTSSIIQDLDSIDWSFTNDDTDFLTHDLHPYPAKYIPQIPGNLISRLSQHGEIVFDPFGGSGTTALEAVRLGRRALSLDANPVGTLIGKVKTCNLDDRALTDLNAIRCALAVRLKELPKDSNKLCLDYKTFIPEIPNIDKWFPLTSRGELALIKSRIGSIENKNAKNIACLALSRIILKVSFQDSETRYSSKPREIPIGETVKKFLFALDEIIQNVIRTQPVLRYGVCNFVTADIRHIDKDIVGDDSIDLIVTSPPYGNAMDYHLYHRFRLLWLGHDPRKLSKMEIGSHLRHQKESTGFDEYLNEMTEGLQAMFRVLKPGKYAVLVVGDAIYKKKLYKGAESIGERAVKLGFENLAIIERQIHKTKRSFVSAGRRASTEKLLLLKKPEQQIRLLLHAPPYRLWPYENILREREIQNVLGCKVKNNGGSFSVKVNSNSANRARKLVFSHSIEYPKGTHTPTWQSIIENGFALNSSSRKDPKYFTHGLHNYKGKFYPQLAKGLINLCELQGGSNILDPFCGSGTTLLEGYLNGHKCFGIDMNPLAAKIARVKVGVLDVNPNVLKESVFTIQKKIEEMPATCSEQRTEFETDCIEEIESWFPASVTNKLNWILKTIRGFSDGIMQDFFLVILSDIIRNISHQDPNDLRIRRRKIPLKDADVRKLFLAGIQSQYARIERFWSVSGYSPNRFYPSQVIEGDSRVWDNFKNMGIHENNVDLILTSPPYATALPYIDTDRLSLLTLLGFSTSKRRPIENKLIGSREIITNEKRELEEKLTDMESPLPQIVKDHLLDLFRRVTDANVGFRRKNMPALLLRFFQDMNKTLYNCFRVLKTGGKALIVIGDNRIKVNNEYERIPTTDFLEIIARKCGFKSLERIDISVTTENLVHIKNSITKNAVLWLEKP